MENTTTEIQAKAFIVHSLRQKHSVFTRDCECHRRRHWKFKRTQEPAWLRFPGCTLI